MDLPQHRKINKMNTFELAKHVCRSFENYYGVESSNSPLFLSLTTAINNQDEKSLLTELPIAFDVLREINCEDVDALQSMLSHCLA